MEFSPKAETKASGLCPDEKGVRLMGNGRWAKALRFLVCFLIALAVMMYISPKAC